MNNDKLDKIILKLIEQDEKITDLATNTQFCEFADKITGTLEDMATRVKRIYEDRVLTYQWIKRIEEKVEQHDDILSKMKIQLRIV